MYCNHQLRRFVWNIIKKIQILLLVVSSMAKLLCGIQEEEQILLNLVLLNLVIEIPLITFYGSIQNQEQNSSVRLQMDNVNGELLSLEIHPYSLFAYECFFFNKI